MHNSFSSSEISSFNFSKKVVTSKLYPIRKNAHHNMLQGELKNILFDVHP